MLYSERLKFNIHKYLVKDMIYRSLIFFALICLMHSCAAPFRCKDCCGMDEFVLDSYKIGEGVLAIQEMQGNVPHDHNKAISPDLLAEYPDIIHDGDLLSISMFIPKLASYAPNIQRLSETMGFLVNDLSILLPDVGFVEVAGMTLFEASRKIQGKCIEQMGNIDVSLFFKHRVGRTVELAGLVHIPSIQADGKLTLFDALSKAKIPFEANLFNSYFKRNNCLLPIDFHKLLKEGDMSQNVVLKEGDKIYIADPSTSSVMVFGEVGVERKVLLSSGKISIIEALAEARGIPYTGDRSYIQVFRGGTRCPKIYLLSWEHLVRLPNSSTLLMPGDMVLVSSKPITQWSRFVSQLLPTVAGAEMLTNGAKSVGVIVQ